MNNFMVLRIGNENGIGRDPGMAARKTLLASFAGCVTNKNG